MGLRFSVYFLSAVLLGLAWGAAPQGAAQAQTQATAELGPAAAEARRRALFPRMLRNPADIDLALEYARLSVIAGDLEGAVSTLERVLIFEPGLARLRAELGVLYYRLGGLDTADAYFEEALSAPDVPPDVRARIDEFRGSIARRTASQRFSGAFSFGLRHQSNANALPGPGTVLVGGLPFVLGPGAIGTPDTNAYATLSLRFAFDLPGQGDVFEFGLRATAEGYARQTGFNLLAGELRMGPVFSLGRFGDADGFVSLQGVFGAVELGGTPYLRLGGVSARLGTSIGEATSLSLELTSRHETYVNSALRPTAAQRSGRVVAGSVQLDHALSGRLAVFGRVGTLDRSARVAFQTSSEVQAAFGATWRFDGPGEGRAGPWVLGLTLGQTYRRFAAPDPVIDPVNAQRDRESFAQLTLLAPISPRWAVEGALTYRDVASTYAIRSFDNFGISLGLTTRF